jgi:hypothetical protein
MHSTGTRAQVWHGTAKKTPGGLTKQNLMMNKHGRIVSRRKHASGKKSIKHLEKMGYKAKKGEFKLFRKHSEHKSRRMRGGVLMPENLGAQAAVAAVGGRSRRMRGGLGRSRRMMGGVLMPENLGAQAAVAAVGGRSRRMMGGLGRSRRMMGGLGKSRRMMGGMALGGQLFPQDYNGQGVGTSGVDLQFVAGNAA